MTTKTSHRKRPQIPIRQLVELPRRASADHAVSRCQAAPSSAAMHAAFTQEVRPQMRLHDR